MKKIHATVIISLFIFFNSFAQTQATIKVISGKINKYNFKMSKPTNSSSYIAKGLRINKGLFTGQSIGTRVKVNKITKKNLKPYHKFK